jgi:Spy/CpxP family protein refolding chaperone
MQSSCRASHFAARATQIGCLLSLAAGLVVLPVRAFDPGSGQHQPQQLIQLQQGQLQQGQLQQGQLQQGQLQLGQLQGSDLLCQNNSDGATLPPPTRKPPVASDESGGDRKKRHKSGDDSTTGPQGLSSDTKRGDGKTADADTSKPMRPPNGRGDQQRPGAAGRRGGFFGEMDFSLLNLTDEQKEKIEQIRTENRPKMRDVHRRLGESFKQMSDLMFDGTSTEAQIRKKGDEVRLIHKEVDDLQLNDFLAIRAILTPEQRTKLKDVKTAMDEKRRSAYDSLGARRNPPAEGSGKSDSKRGSTDGAPSVRSSQSKRPVDPGSKPDSLSNR